METPVLFLVFNRPEITAQTFARIRSARPRQLFIAADGPRRNVSADRANCKQVRDIVQAIDWQCDVHYLLREDNFGCGRAVSSGIDWFFDHVDRGIILEDDCYPGADFFRYMEEVLERYSGNDRVMMVSGCSLHAGMRRTRYSYFFSRYCHMWGWGTWKSAWNKYDFDMKSYQHFKADAGLENILDDPHQAAFWYKTFDRMIRREIDTWDYQWVYALLSSDGLSVYPEVNLISNIGFGTHATHTKNEKHPFSMVPTVPIGELSHPEFVFPNREADGFSARKVFRIGP